MTGLALLRYSFILIAMVGLVVNVWELVMAKAIYRRLLASRTNGLRHQSAANLLSSAKHRLVAQFFLLVILGVVIVAGAPPRERTTLATIARGAFIGLGWTITQAGFAARAGRKKTEALIDTEIAEAEGPKDVA